MSIRQPPAWAPCRDQKEQQTESEPGPVWLVPQPEDTGQITSASMMQAFIVEKKTLASARPLIINNVFLSLFLLTWISSSAGQREDSKRLQGVSYDNGLVWGECQ